MRICIPTGTADATGEKTAFQAKNGFFHSGVSFFALALSLRFPLKIANMPARRTPRAIHSPRGDRLIGDIDTPENSAARAHPTQQITASTPRPCTSFSLGQPAEPCGQRELRREVLYACPVEPTIRKATRK